MKHLPSNESPDKNTAQTDKDPKIEIQHKHNIGNILLTYMCFFLIYIICYELCLLLNYSSYKWL